MIRIRKHDEILVATFIIISLLLILSNCSLFYKTTRQAARESPNLEGQTPSAESPASVTHKHPSPTNILASEWTTYRSEKYGFAVKYPVRWGDVMETTDYAGNEYILFGVAPPSGDALVMVTFPKDMDSAIDRIGDQFIQRTVAREDITINGVDAVLVTISTPESPEWESSRIFITGGEYIYEISTSLTFEDDVIQSVIKSFTLLR